MVRNPPKPEVRRRDATGHLDPRYAAELLEQSGDRNTSDPPPSGLVNESDDLAEQLGENFVQAATSAEDGDGDVGDELIRDEPLVADADDDDIVFEPEELSFPKAKPRRADAAPEPARKAPRKTAKVAKSRSVNSKRSRGSSASSAKAGKSKTTKSKRVQKKAAKPKARRGSSGAKGKVAKPTPARSKSARKTAKRKVKRKTA